MADPKRIDFGDAIGYNMRGVVLGGFFTLFGIFLLIRNIFTDLGNNKLIRSGMKISAEFFFVSKTYTIDPAPYLNGRYHIDVFIDPADPHKYYMDTSFMPKGNNTIG